MKRVTIGLFVLLVSSVLPVSAATTATTSDAVSASVSTDQWYETERVFGRVDVGDFVVGPGRTEVTLDPGQAITRIITVTNRISDNRTFTLQVEDISGTADGSEALQVYEGERGPYSIKDYISFPEETITLDLGERARVPVTITVPPDAEPGGFYGSVLVSTVQTGERGANPAPQNPIIARVGSHIFPDCGWRANSCW